MNNITWMGTKNEAITVQPHKVKGHTVYHILVNFQKVGVVAQMGKDDWRGVSLKWKGNRNGMFGAIDAILLGVNVVAAR